jgi:Kef-type K+ transport system membrane component KefB
MPIKCLKKQSQKWVPALALFMLAFQPQLAWAGGDGGHRLLSGISVSIVAATLLAFLAYRLKQPLLLAYIVAGAIIGPQFGLGLVQSKDDIRVITEIGLILLLFMIGLELDLKKIKAAGKSLLVTGVFQFVLCLLLGLGFFTLMGFTIGPPYQYVIFGVKLQGGEYDLLYLAACVALSSTAIVVKLLHEKFELDTLAGRLTLGVLVFQDLWAIILLSVQPTLSNPQVMGLLLNFAEAAGLVLFSLLLSKYALGYLFRTIAKVPELVLVASLAWCFLICGLAGYFGLSLEMGALIAGASISTFPYNLDIISKIVGIRDFFLTLFFVALGMEIPNPLQNLGMLLVAGVTALFVVASRFLSVFPLLRGLKNGNRVSLLTSINLSQVSEFALVITAIGLKSGHIVPDIFTLIIYAFVITSIVSTYMITFNQGLQGFLNRLLNRAGLKSLGREDREEGEAEPREIVLLGCFRIGSALVKEMQETAPALLDYLLVVDFNPEVYRNLRTQGVPAVYGDIAHLAMLQHAGVEHAKLVISSLSDDILVGTTNLKLLKTIREICPEARVILTATNAAQAVALYLAGADYVLLPNVIAGRQLLAVMQSILQEPEVNFKEEELPRLVGRQEVLR